MRININLNLIYLLTIKIKFQVYHLNTTILFSLNCARSFLYTTTVFIFANKAKLILFFELSYEALVLNFKHDMFLVFLPKYF